MTDEVIDTRAQCYSGGVTFRMRAPGGSIAVRVTNEALLERDGAKAHADYTKMFDRHRYTIESVARRKLMAKRLERDGSVLVSGVDLQD